ncbi:hypothetical protein ACH5RR_026210 [Cinchona calisaya]|uniref:Mitochondrial transcription termination factor n=1 Tax=Cinchona calisaya TaxID=153742 RepID=A0ABD2Z1W0_9GENT
MLRILMRNPKRFKESVERVKRIGFNPQKTNFLEATYVMASTATETWKHKMEVYKRCGWSEEEVLAAFRRFPKCMSRSENKILPVTDLLVQKMGFDPSALMKRPQIFSFILKKRIIPRCSVYQALLSKGLVNKKLGMAQMLEVPEKVFPSEVCQLPQRGRC